MPLLLLLTALILGLQYLHLRLLRRMLPDQAGPWIPWGLLLLHLPLLFYMLLRMTGNALPLPIMLLLRNLARAAFYFQALTLINLGVGWGAWGLWRLFHLKRKKAEPLDPQRRTFLRRSALLSLGAVGALGAKGAAQAYGKPEHVRLDLPFPDLPAGLDGLRILHLTDVHAGPMAGLDTLRMWRRLAERENAELLLFTGDFVDSQPDELLPFMEAFRDFPAPLGRFAVLGNHDFFMDPRPIWQGLEAMGITCLENRNAVVERGGSRLAILGLQDPMAVDGRFQGLRFGEGPRPEQAARYLPADAFTLALLHRPAMWPLAIQARARLSLAGHTHGGQINLLPGVNSAKLLGPETGGLYRKGANQLYVSRGLGVVGLPVRIAAPPEITVLTLRRG